MRIKLTILTLMFLLIFNHSIFASQAEKDIIRLHVVANSDSPEDQRLKLEVRDFILQQLTNLKDLKNTAQAYDYLRERRGKLTENISKYIKELGFKYSVKTELGQSRFPTRKYNDRLTLPAGEYVALKIIIGEGKGSNWWCVLYPPICHGDWVKKTEKSMVDNREAIPTLQQEILKKEPNKSKQLWQNFLQLFSSVWRIM